MLFINIKLQDFDPVFQQH